jgi:hypothetical protein
VTVEEFRRMALAMPEAEERAHMAHPDFRVRGKIFATLGYPAEGWGMVKLNPEQQYDFSRAAPEVFVPVKGSWGSRGCTNVRLEAADPASVRRAMEAAWRNTAPKALAGKL